MKAYIRRLLKLSAAGLALGITASVGVSVGQAIELTQPLTGAHLAMLHRITASQPQVVRTAMLAADADGVVTVDEENAIYTLIDYVSHQSMVIERRRMPVTPPAASPSTGATVPQAPMTMPHGPVHIPDPSRTTPMRIDPNSMV